MSFLFLFFFLREKEMRELRENFLKLICKNYVVLEDLMASCQWDGLPLTTNRLFMDKNDKNKF